MESQIMDSRITEVTVFSDRAMVTRSGKIKLPVGEHSILFENLPDCLTPNSLQLSGTGPAVLSRVKLIRKNFSETPFEKVKEILTEIENLADQRSEINDKLSAAEKEKSFLEKMASRLTETGEGKNAATLNPEDWMKMSEFYRSRQDDLLNEIRGFKKELSDLDKKISKAKNDLHWLKGQGSKTRYFGEVHIEMKEESEISLDLSYIAENCGWMPLYQLRADSVQKSVSVTYDAKVFNQSTEDWNDVSLSLSTARPQIGGKEPELSPSYLRFYVPRPPAPLKRTSRELKKSAMPDFGAAPPEAEEDDLLMASVDIAEPAMESKEAEFEEGALAVTFRIPGTTSIQSDGEYSEVSIWVKELESRFSYSAVPRLSEFAYLKAKMKNTTGVPFLAGEANVFLDGNFIATTEIPLVSDTEEFEASLGIDESIKIEYHDLSFHKKSGLIGKKSQKTFTFETTLTSHKTTPEEFTLKDRIPKSSESEIIVKLLSPTIKENSDALSLDNKGILTWNFTLKPSEKKTVTLEYSVEYPQEKTVEGLS